MRLKLGFILLSIICISTACNNTAGPVANTANLNTSNSVANTNTISNSTAPTKESLVALEKQASEAWKNKDGKFFDKFLAADFMIMEGGMRGDKAGTVKMISENPCEIGSVSLSDEHVSQVNADVAVLTAKVTADVTCEGKKMPSPLTSTTVYVREGNEWKGAFHSEVPIVDPKAKSGDKPAPPPASDAKAPANAELTANLVEREKAGWDAWKNADKAKLEEFIAANAAGVGMMGDRMATKADLVKAWTEPCDVKDIKLSNEQAVEISPGVALLMYKGIATGKCGDMPIMPQWATTVYVKEGDTWKGAYFVASPA